MEDDKKKKFSFLGSLGFLGKDKKSTAPPQAENNRNEFYVGNVQEDLKKKKKVLEEIK